MEIIYQTNDPDTVKKECEKTVTTFSEILCPLEDKIYLLEDKVTGAKYCECHILADKFIKYSTKDVPLDPDEQPEYRANRELVMDSNAFQQMKLDAQNGRNFSNIVTEFNQTFDTDHPLKIVGGQHRYEAINDSLGSGINEFHGVKVYFNLNIEQRLDVQLISNTNIAVSSDLLDRMMETVKGPELRKWCQKVGLLSEDLDFADRKQRGTSITVREARTFIMNYYKGKSLVNEIFEHTKTQSILAKTGGVDDEWEKLKKDIPKMWDDKGLIEAGKMFALLASEQSNYYSEGGKKSNKEYADKAYNYAILAAWSYVAGLLSNNKVRHDRHYALSQNRKKDPLNAEALAKARHKSDPVNYRGLGSRTDAKERGRLVELFYLQAEKGDGISKPLIDVALTKYFAKQAHLEVIEAERRLK